MEDKESSDDCPDKEKVLDLINVNAELWRRFRALPNYSSFSIPDKHFLENFYFGSNLMGLTRLNNVYILDLQTQGQSEQAMEEWLSYMKLYLKMVNEPLGKGEKAVLLAILKTQFSVLDMLIHNDHGLVLSYGDQIQQLLNITDVNFFGAEDLFVNDWIDLELMFLSYIGDVPNFRRLVYKCAEENKRVSLLSADEFFQMKDFEFCSEIYSEDPNIWISRSFTDPGNLFSNMILYFIMEGHLSGGDLIANMHKLVADFKMASVSIELISNKVLAHEAEGYLKAMPEVYWNPITRSPFLWDEEKQKLHYLSPIEDPVGCSY